MTAEIIFIIILSIVVITFIIEQIIDFLNARCFSNPIPKILKGIYDSEKYKTQQKYKIDNYKFSIISSIFSFACIFLMLIFKGFAFLNNIVINISENYILQSLLFFLIIFLVYSVLEIPFNIYDNFVIEKKYGFNKTTAKIFISDILKSFLLTLILGGGILTLILLAFNYLPFYLFWIIALAIIIIFSLLSSIFYTSLILPLFNKLTELPEGELKNAIENFANKVNFNLKSVVVMDSSKRSTKANAFFTGIGKRKKIVLYDSLINEMTNEEILAVLAHEIGHYKERHIYKSLIISILEMSIILFVFALFAKSEAISQALSVDIPNFHIATIAFSIIYSPLSTLLNIFTNKLSRKHEYQADNFAKKQGFSKDLISALKKLASHNMSNLTPHKLTVLLEYSHPPLNERIENLEN